MTARYALCIHSVSVHYPFSDRSVAVLYSLCVCSESALCPPCIRSEFALCPPGDATPAGWRLHLSCGDRQRYQRPSCRVSAAGAARERRPPHMGRYRRRSVIHHRRRAERPTIGHGNIGRPPAAAERRATGRHRARGWRGGAH